METLTTRFSRREVSIRVSFFRSPPKKGKRALLGDLDKVLKESLVLGSDTRFAVQCTEVCRDIRGLRIHLLRVLR